MSNSRISCILAILTLMMSGLSARCQAVYFIFNGPAVERESPNVFNETRLYRFDENSGELRQVWIPGKMREAHKIGIYPSSGKMIICADRENPRVLNVFDLDKTERPRQIIPSENLRISDFHYYQMQKEADVIEITSVIRSEDKSPQVLRKYFSIEGKEISFDSKNSAISGELRLAGPRPNGAYADDVVGIWGFPNDSIYATHTGFNFKIARISEGIIQQGSSRGWELITCEADFYVLHSIPDRSDLTHTEFLIYNRLNERWNSLLIEGGETYPALINGWLIGKIKDINPDSDIENRLAYPAIVRNETILINPLTNTHFKIDFGAGGQVLWIEDNIIYFKKMNDLYKAELDNGILTNVELILTDPAVKHFKWAYKSRHESIEKTIQTD